jgi:hypothetical protein
LLLLAHIAENQFAKRRARCEDIADTQAVHLEVQFLLFHLHLREQTSTYCDSRTNIGTPVVPPAILRSPWLPFAFDSRVMVVYASPFTTLLMCLSSPALQKDTRAHDPSACVTQKPTTSAFKFPLLYTALIMLPPFLALSTPFSRKPWDFMSSFFGAFG